MSKFNIEEYETVDERIHKFWELCPMGSITTDLFSETRSDGRLEWVCKATILVYPEGRVIATGWATEYEGAQRS